MILKVNTTPAYEILIESGIVLENGLPKGFLITDSNVARIYPNLTKNAFIIESGEKSKSIENYNKILNALSLTDYNSVIALGGGVVGDLAGFVASTYKRGINLIQIPTTLLAMVDSSIGGKNAVNLKSIKNAVGTIYQPQKIIIDSLFLKTLPELEKKNGTAEIIKYNFIFGKPEIKEIESIESKFQNVIYECCNLKAKVVEKDEKDKNYRHILNFGHTIGHAIELFYNFSHGEAVSIGMVKEAEIALKLNIINENKLDNLKNILNHFSLPTKLPEDFDLESAISIMKKDKKGEFIFAFSEANPNLKIDEEVVREVLSK